MRRALLPVPFQKRNDMPSSDCGRAVGKPFASYAVAATTGKFPRGLSDVMVGVQRRERVHCSRWMYRRAPLEPSVSACHSSDKRLSIRT